MSHYIAGYVVAEKPIRVGQRRLEPGMPIPPGYPVDTLVKYGQARPVGEMAWEAACEEHGEPPEDFPADGFWCYEEEDPEDVTWLVPRPDSVAEGEEEEEQEEEPAEGEAVVEHVGGGWYDVLVDDEPINETRLRKKAASALAKKHNG